MVNNIKTYSNVTLKLSAVRKTDSYISTDNK